MLMGSGPTLASMSRRRCRECRKWFTPAVSAVDHQLVCGGACRGQRRNRLARQRRHDDLDEQRADERARQQQRRWGRAKAAGCHELPSDGNSAELLRKVEQIVDKAASLSRATLRRDLGRILRKIGPLWPAKVDRAVGCHELPSALEAGGNGSRSSLDVDGVTSLSGAG